MKNKKISLLGVALVCLFTACDRHDNFDDSAIIGEMAPQVYWELASSVVTAGNEVGFTAQYYTTNEEADIDHLEVWYSVEESESRSVTCPWMVSTTFNYLNSTTEEKRGSQKISEYPHSEELWEDSVSAYYLEATFPTSYTLSAVNMAKSTTFGAEDSALVKKYFGETFMEDFKDSLYTVMTSADFQKMYQGLNLVENFKEQFMDSTENDNVTGGYEYHFPLDPETQEEVVPQEVQDMYRNIPFADLIFSAEGYALEFTRSYTLYPVLKVVDKADNMGSTVVSETKVINLN